MSKPWFLKMALEAEPTPLARRIADVLQTAKGEAQTNSVEKSSTGLKVGAAEKSS